MTKFLTIGATLLTLGAAPVMADDIMDIATQSGACGSGSVASAALDAATGNILVTCGNPVGVTQSEVAGGAGGAAGGVAGTTAGTVGGVAGGLGGIAAGGVTAFAGIAVPLGVTVAVTAGSIVAGNAGGGSTPNTTN
ncbi:hypothetical protein [Pseudoroseicyclus tamaricis]|uniref:Uncharacterized protein n=1 Tax=Pseudoroseicyclus tamaricis TaxID=2705421 RepID=A0A6B2JYF3_9RHOB|nr:hypothetical protein [Pseudoroseicyclus tamaricis]NDV02795.1 hypothetical protein [Pseudoroseicyclus tamaricis]